VIPTDVKKRECQANRQWRRSET